MVRPRPILAVMAIAATVGPAAAQSVDWSRAGGDLFGRPAILRAAETPPASEPSAVLPPLRQPYGEAVAVAAERHGLDPKLLHALVIVESGYRPDAVSSAGAGGLTQLMPGTAVELGVADRFDVDQNLDGGADYLARQLNRFGDVRLALAAYNAGPGRVARLGRVPEIAETQTYVVRVVDCYLAMTAGRPVRHARDCHPAGGRP